MPVRGDVGVYRPGIEELGTEVVADRSYTRDAHKTLNVLSATTV